MKKYIVAGILFAATMLVSCGGLQSFTFDQLYPAEVTFPEQVRTVAVVNHAPAIPSPKKNLLTLGKMEKCCQKLWPEAWRIVVIFSR